jgi:hypothetical protein
MVLPTSRLTYEASCVLYVHIHPTPKEAGRCLTVVVASGRWWGDGGRKD